MLHAHRSHRFIWPEWRLGIITANEVDYYTLEVKEIVLLVDRSGPTTVAAAFGFNISDQFDGI